MKKRKGERPDGLIQVSCTDGYNPDGSRKRKYFYGHTRAEAERKRDEYLNQDKTVDPNITVEQWITQYRETYTKVNPLYKDATASYYKRMIKAFGNRTLKTITNIDLQKTVNEMEGFSYSAVAKYAQVIKAVFRKAHKNKYIKDDPSDDLVLPKYTKTGTHKALDRDTIRAICAHWKDSPCGLWIMIMLFCGLRRGEMMGLQWDCIDMDRRTLTVRRTAVASKGQTVIEERAKSSAGIRTVPVPDVLYNALCVTPSSERHGLVCHLDPLKPLTCYEVEKLRAQFQRIINAQFRLHDLRHTYCTLLYESGVDVKTAAYLMGHANIQVTMTIYTHLSEQQKSQSTSNLMRMLDTFK